MNCSYHLKRKNDEIYMLINIKLNYINESFNELLEKIWTLLNEFTKGH
jgi:hypothetical protein